MCVMGFFLLKVGPPHGKIFWIRACTICLFICYFANRHSYCSYGLYSIWSGFFCILFNVAARSKIFNNMQMSPCIIGEGLQTLGLCSGRTASDQGRIFNRATLAVKWTSGLHQLGNFLVRWARGGGYCENLL